MMVVVEVAARMIMLVVLMTVQVETTVRTMVEEKMKMEKTMEERMMMLVMMLVKQKQIQIKQLLSTTIKKKMHYQLVPEQIIVRINL